MGIKKKRLRLAAKQAKREIVANAVSQQENSIIKEVLKKTIEPVEEAVIELKEPAFEMDESSKAEAKKGIAVKASTKKTRARKRKSKSSK